MVDATDVLERLARDAKIVMKNISLSPTDNLHSILGDAADWKSEPGSLSEVAYFAELIAERRAAIRFSELGSLDGTWRAIKLIDRLRARFFPLPFFSERPCSIRQHAPDHFPREAWFFINGIATDKELLAMNGRYLVRLFQRPIELIYNPTEGPLLDLLECMLGRTFDFVSAPAEYALERVSLALANPEKDRGILMGHSQGGIIVSNVVSALIERFSGDRERMSKLEVYTFASAADRIRTDPELDTQQRHVPFIEHFANTQDMVARLGVLERGLPVSGKVYTLEKAGHFLNAHYLLEIEASQAYAWHDADGKSHRTARLYEYLRGGTPELLPIEATAHPERAKRGAESRVVVGLA